MQRQFHALSVGKGGQGGWGKSIWFDIVIAEVRACVPVWGAKLGELMKYESSPYPPSVFETKRLLQKPDKPVLLGGYKGPLLPWMPLPLSSLTIERCLRWSFLVPAVDWEKCIQFTYWKKCILLKLNKAIKLNPGHFKGELKSYHSFWWQDVI